MAENSKIEWCDHTFNPWRGCTKVSAGCANCYAETLSRRNPKVLGTWGKGQPRVLASEAMWKEPLKWNEALTHECPSCSAQFQNVTSPSGLECYCSSGGSVCHPLRPKVFCASLADWLDEEVPVEWLGRLLNLIRLTPNLDWLLLTKRPQNFERRMNLALEWVLGEDGEPCNEADFIDGWVNKVDRIPANVWLGTSVENQAMADERVPVLLSIPARVRFLSCEPLLGAVDLTAAAPNPFGFFEEGIQWVICGGESGPNARPMHPDWARGLRDQCASAGVPFLFKQWGAYGVSGDWPDHLVRMEKKKAGRVLDGVEHHGFPDIK